MRYLITRLAALLILVISVPPALAHKPSDSYLSLWVGDGMVIEGQWDIALRDLDFVIGLDADENGVITWGELKLRHGDIAAYALVRLMLAGDGMPCVLRPTGHLVDVHSDGAYAVLRFSADCPKKFLILDTDYRLLFDVDRQHKGLLRLVYGGETSSAVYTPEQPVRRFKLGDPEPLRQFGEYLAQGFWHIWIGIDHILFLLSLLLPSVLIWRESRWMPVDSFRPALIDVLKVVTAFTLAHSITLTLAALGVIELPTRLVESVIALSVVLAAANNLVPRVSRGRWLAAFGFGLIHGFGFASVLADLGLPQETLVLSLVGFNVGVELGQLVIVCVFLPAAFLIRARTVYREGILRGGSVFIGLTAGAWLIERALNLKFMPF